MRKALVLLGLFLASIPLYAQALPATTAYNVVATWTALPPVCTTTAPCTFALYRLSSACPSSVASTTGWTLVATSVSQALTITDPNPPAGQICELIVPKQGTAVGPISNTVPVTIPPSLTAVSVTVKTITITVAVQ